MFTLAALEAFEKERPELALATVIGTRGSTPRHLGTLMLVAACGDILGTVGGGRVELEVATAARKTATEGGSFQVEHHLVRDLAMCCGGSMEFLIQDFSYCRTALRMALQARLERQSGLLVFSLGSGARFEVGTEIGDRARRTDDELQIPVLPEPRLLVFGCGHLSRAIGPMARTLGFEVIVCDDNQTGAVDTDLPWAQVVVPSFSLRDVEREVGLLGTADHVLVLTRDHGIDEMLIESLLPRVQGLGYLGLIGSPGKVLRFKKRLSLREGFRDEDWALLDAPMGLSIGAETPEEIAVSILAGLVQLRRRGDIA